MSDHMSAVGFSTLALHAGTRPGRDAGRAPMAAPVDSVPASGTPSPHAASELGGDDTDAHAISSMLEERVTALEGGSAALAIGSGRAARFLALAALLRPGDDVIVSRATPGGSIDDFAHAFQSFGWRVRWVDPNHPGSFVDALSETTKAIFCESIAEADGAMTDMDPIAALARRARVPLIVDNTLATPYLLRPFERGADIVLHRAVEFLAGHGHAGLIVDGGNFDWMQDDRYPMMSGASPVGTTADDTFGAFAAACRALGLRTLDQRPSPLNAAMVLAGIETLPLRMRRHCENALEVAHHLRRHRAVRWVRYAGLQDDRGHALAWRTAPHGAGAVFTFGVENAAAIIGRLRLFTPAAGIGGTRSLVMPSAAIGREGEASGGEAVRLAIGLEDAVDLVADLDGALAQARAG